MCATLEELASACHGDERPECPILRDLEAGGGRPATARGRRTKEFDLGTKVITWQSFEGGTT
jgi:hypothetical protein